MSRAMFKSWLRYWFESKSLEIVPRQVQYQSKNKMSSSIPDQFNTFICQYLAKVTLRIIRSHDKFLAEVICIHTKSIPPKTTRCWVKFLAKEKPLPKHLLYVHFVVKILQPEVILEPMLNIYMKEKRRID